MSLRTPSPSALSPLAMAMTLALSSTAHAETPTEPKTMSKLSAEADADTPKVEAVDSPKFTQPLLDTPQTITVVTQRVLQQQGAATLMEALANTPGITMQLGENGNTAAGDTFSIRGYASQSNVFSDGMRDLGSITRDTFNVESVEIAKGAVGADYGRGTTAGYINQVSKLPVADDFGTAIVSASTATRVRTAADWNTVIGDGSALRLNAVWQDGSAVKRDKVTDNRWGVAPGIAFGLGSPTTLYLYSQHIRANKVPDGGVPAIGLPGFYSAALAAAGAPQQEPVDRENFYGRYDDYEKQKADMATLRIDHVFNDQVRLTNRTRWGQSSMERVMTGINALNFTTLSNPSTWTVTRIRQSLVQENKLLTNQTNLVVQFRTGGIEHDLTSGVELIREQQYSPVYTGLGTLPNANLYNPNPYDNYTDTYARAPNGAFSDGKSTTLAGYAFDTLKFNDQWQVLTGLRVDHYRTKLEGAAVATATNYPTAPLGSLVRANLKDDGNLLSWKLAVVFKPTKNSSIYASYNDAKQPPGGTNFVLSDPNAANTTTNINRPGLDPQHAKNFEVGAKWDVINEQLSLTAALYRTDNYNEVSQPDPVSNEVDSLGKHRVQGLELGAVGKIGDNWEILTGFAYSDNKIIAGSTGNNSPGATARFAPEYSANLWTIYHLNDLSLGLGGNYVSKQLRVVDPAVNPATAAGLPSIPGYTVLNAMVGYEFTDALGLQLNVYNLADKTYISSLNNGGSRLRLGALRFAQLTATYKF